jgi:hypothetical protein
MYFGYLFVVDVMSVLCHNIITAKVKSIENFNVVGVDSK